MAYEVSNVVWGSTNCDSLASCFYFFAFLMCHYAVMLSLGLEKVCPRSRPQPQRGYFLLVVLWNRTSIYIGFWRWALGILQYPSRKGYYIFRGGPDLKKWRRAPDGCVTPLLFCQDQDQDQDQDFLAKTKARLFISRSRPSPRLLDFLS